MIYRSKEDLEREIKAYKKIAECVSKYIEDRLNAVTDECCKRIIETTNECCERITNTMNNKKE